MKLSEFTKNDVTIKYMCRQGVEKQKLLVVITNPCTADGSIEFIFSLNAINQSNKLFIANDYALRNGYFLIKDGKWSIRDTLIDLIEQERKKCGIEVSDVYVIGYCGAAITAFCICLECGYNGILSLFLFNSCAISPAEFLQKGEKGKCFAKKYEDNLDKIFLTRDFFIDREKYSGIKDYSSFCSDALYRIKEISPDNLRKVKFYLHYGKYEDYYNIEGESTMQILRDNSISYEVKIDEEEYDHFNAPAYFVKYLVNKLNELEIK